MVPPGSDRVSRVRSYSGTCSGGRSFRLRDDCPLWCAVPHASTSYRLGNSCQAGHGLDNTPYNPGYATRGRLHVPRFGLIRFRSPLLTESRLIYFPRGTEMFHFPRLPPSDLCVQSAVTPHYERRVSPFGHLRITGCSAPTRSFSQPSTSFIGSRCQGIHHLPLLS